MNRKELILNPSQIVLFKKLISKGININAEPDQNPSPLQGAALFGLEDIVVELLNKGINSGEYDNALNAAMTNGNMNIIRILVSKGAVLLNSNQLCEAIRSKNHELVMFLIESGTPVNWIKTYESNQPLYIAVQTKQTDMVKYLLEHGADPNSSCLACALWDNSDEIIDLLFQYGAKLK